MRSIFRPSQAMEIRNAGALTSQSQGDRVMPRDLEKLLAEKLSKSSPILDRARKVLLSPTVTGPFRAP
jgi:hypothetical protein